VIFIAGVFWFAGMGILFSVMFPECLCWLERKRPMLTREQQLERLFIAACQKPRPGTLANLVTERANLREGWRGPRGAPVPTAEPVFAPKRGIRRTYVSVTREKEKEYAN